MIIFNTSGSVFSHCCRARATKQVEAQIFSAKEPGIARLFTGALRRLICMTRRGLTVFAAEIFDHTAKEMADTLRHL